MTIWQTPIGTRGTRADFKALYGGSIQGGIQTPQGSDSILVFSDPKPAEMYGYALDGWSSDRSVFRYTGHGSRGDQALHRGNLAIADHAKDGRSLRLFLAVGTVEGGGSRIHEYQGEFSLDSENPHVLQTQADQDGVQRKTFVFNLVPVGQVVHKHDETTSPKALVPGLAYFETVELEASNMTNFEIPAQDAKEGEKVEAGLVNAFKDVLTARGREGKRFRIYAPGAKQPMFTDIFDVSENVLYEAKASASRVDVRGALGQILDYRRFVKVDACNVLLPERPAQDLVELLASLDIGVVFRAGDSSFLIAGEGDDQAF